MFRVSLSVCMTVVLLATSQASGQRPGGFLLADSNPSNAIEEPEAMPLVPQSISVKEKDPWIAFLLSAVIVGSGQVYNEQVGKGVLQFTGAVTGLALLISEDEKGREDSDKALIGACVWLGSFMWSVIDAPVTANRINREARQTSLQIYPVIRNDLAGASLTFKF